MLRKLVLLALLAQVPPCFAATLPAGFTETQLASGIVRPTAMALAPDGRIFVCEQTGKLRVIKDSRLLPDPFVTVPVFSEGERGLVGVTVDPDFPATPYVYLYYTAVKPVVHNRVSRFTAGGDRAVKGSEVAILDLPQLAKPIHNSGTLHFGPDGYLYIAVGENGVPENAQSLATPLGKILRIAKDGTIPADNPFYDQTSGVARAIWAMGLRNPFSFSFQPGTGRMFINDVGNKTWEEIDDGIAGANYGWPVAEGPTSDPRFQAPLYAYRHGPTPETGCAISGGAFYDPEEPQLPSSFVGTYLFADFCSGWIRRFDPATRAVTSFATGIGGPIGLQVGADGFLYYLAYEDGTVSQIGYTGSEAPRISAQPQDATVAAGAMASFQVEATGAPPLRYQWRRDGSPIAGATGAVYTLAAAALSDDGAAFDVVVSNDQGSATSEAAVLTVLDDQPPQARITSPDPGLLYSGGQTIVYAGEGTDPEDGALPASAFTWRVDFHHLDHVHPYIPDAPGAAGGSFLIPPVGETSTDVWYRIHLTVKDSDGLTGTTFVDIRPRIVHMTFQTDPAGLQVAFDYEERVAPFTEPSVAGIFRNIGAPTPQVLDNVTYDFVSWSDGVTAPSYNLPAPAADTTYTAVFEPRTHGGHGLFATYFDNPDLTVAVLTRVDPNIDYDWKLGSPAPGVSPDTFSVRWTGKLEARVSGPHVFLLRADNGARLWLDGNLVVAGSRGRIFLEAGRKYDLRVEYYENKGAANVALLWQAPGLKRQVVPEEQLTP
ncbi:MAG: PQQ-dependent sugar dehydrogenase [Acidobacteriota bacterium]